MPSGLLTLLKYVFLVVLYLFFVRVLRAVWVELREPVGSERTVRPAAPGPGAPAPAVRVIAPPERRGQVFAVGTGLTVGRDPACGIALTDDTFVSSVHARFFTRDGAVWVEDLGSTNGTRINDERLAGSAPVRNGDTVTMGRATVELVG